MDRPDLPRDVDLERAVIGGVLLRPELLPTLSLDSDDFYSPHTRAVWDAMRNLEARKQPVDLLLLTAELDRTGKLEAIGGSSFLGECAVLVPVAERVVAYALELRQHRVSRTACLALADIAWQIKTRQVAGMDVVDRVRSVYQSLLEAIPRTNKRTMGEIVGEVVRNVERDFALRESGAQVTAGVETGLRKLDSALGGIPRGVLTLIAGRPGNGKTTLMQTIARHAGAYADKPILYSYEDSDASFGQRELAAATKVPTHKIRSLDMTREQFDRFRQLAPICGRRQWRVAQASGMTVDQLCADVRAERARAKERGEQVGGLVLVDYLQRMPVDPRARYDQELGRICNALVDLAASENIAVVAGSQLNRAVESRDSKVPKLSDLRDSGRLEELAKVVLAVYRPAKYESGARPDQLDVIVLKNHQGDTDVAIGLQWDLELHLITDRRD